MNFRFAKTALSVLIFSVLISNLCRAQPSVTQLLPASQSANVCVDTPLQLTFNEPVVLGSKGKIVVYGAADSQPADAFDSGDTGFTNNFGGKTLRYDPIRITGNVVSVELHSHALHPGENYYVNIDPGVIKSESGHEFGGFTNDSAWKFSTRAALPKGRTNLIVAVDGSGDYCTPQGAVDYVPDDNQLPVEIFVRKGVYDGMICIVPDKSGIHFIGEDRQGTIIAGRNNDRFNSGRIGRALVSVDANDFVLENMTLRNTTPYGGSQAEALRVSSDRCLLRNDDFYSFQDTLLLSGRVYATNCHVEGDVDFIWGQGSVFFDQCEIKAVHKGYYLQARNPAERPGYVFFQCKLTAAPGVAKCLLARIDADRFPFSQAVFIDCQMGAQVPPAGWEVKGTNAGHLRFEEFHSIDAQGKPVDVSQRHPASRQLTASEADELSDPAKVLSYPRPWNPRITAAAPASGPDPKEIPIPEIKTDLGKMPGVNELPARPELPDSMLMNDGAKVTTPEEWEKRREEIKRTLEYYATGEMPPPPGNVKGIEITNQTVLDGKVKYRLVHLTFGPEEKLSLDIGIFTPVQGGPFPTIILQDGPPPFAKALARLPKGPTQGQGQDVLMMVGPAPGATDAGTATESQGTNTPESGAQAIAARNSVVFQRGYALVIYNANDCAEDTTLRNADGSWAFRNTRFFPAYPGYDWSILAAWAWGASRIADYLVTDPAIDNKTIIITGWSRNGKTSMIAAAFDQRLLGAPVVTGGGGIGAYRFAGPRKSETLDKMQRKYPNWFSPHLHEFWGQREKLPFDQHWFLALAAPRPFIALEGDADTISLPDAVKHSIQAAQKVYEFLGAKDNIGVHYSHHAHAFTQEDWGALMDFFDKYSRGMKVDKTFDHFLTDAERDATTSAP